MMDQSKLKKQKSCWETVKRNEKIKNKFKCMKKSILALKNSFSLLNLFKFVLGIELMIYLCSDIKIAK
jgi:hypothetical protein